jgi:hypothetical protein
MEFTSIPVLFCIRLCDKQVDKIHNSQFQFYGAYIYVELELQNICLVQRKIIFSKQLLV